MKLTIRGTYFNIGKLILRIGIGLMLIYHGVPKLMGGPEKWEAVGQAAQYIGIDSIPVFFGFMSALAETFGGLFLILGLYFLPTILIILANFLVAICFHFGSGDGFAGATEAIELFIVFLALLFMGPGRYSIDYNWIRRW
jgi:putative oxidoreductase